MKKFDISKKKNLAAFFTFHKNAGFPKKHSFFLLQANSSFENCLALRNSSDHFAKDRQHSFFSKKSSLQSYKLVFFRKFASKNNIFQKNFVDKSADIHCIHCA
ncbi:hypothetical protein ACO0LD_12595 [Undibacterium sp. Ji83W]|uniref:hypothetical protein n=1 Tax=Undibacterium sp. Ji83W TaxID=3413043 RepID=UPI003BF23801